MKQVLTYLSLFKDFNDEHKMSVKIQIDNSLSLGWKKEDILLFTNFEYEYNGVKSIIIGDENYCQFFFPATKIYVIDYMFRNGLVEDDLYWYHDFDCFQLVSFDEINLDNSEIGLTNYGRMPRLCSASIFFKKTSGDIFSELKKWVDQHKKDEETGFAKIINSNIEYQKRVKKINISYAFHLFNFRHCYIESDKPIKAVHFHLTSDKYDFFIKGKNKLNLVIIPDRLIKIFNEHNFKYE
jgi:hypothetical protein